jgi:muramidase (phage lysozyme)
VRDTIELLAALDSANVRAFLHMIRVGEGTADPDGYRRHFGGRLFDSYADHPRVKITAGLGKNQYTSSAAGAYQFLASTWDGLVKRYGFDDFEPSTQDCAAVALIDGRKALDDVLAGRFEVAVRKCAREWASLPGSPYGQPVKTLEQAKLSYHMAGGLFWPDPISLLEAAPSAAQEPAAITPETGTAPAQPALLITPETVHKEATMPLPLIPIIAALLPSFVEAIPKLGKLFGSGSEVAERNIKAAELAVGIVTEAVGARNAQEAAEMVASDPAAAQAAIAAVEQRWFELSESGGGGIDGARKADAAIAASGSMLQSPSFWVAVALLPLVYMIVGSVVGLFGAPWSDDVRSAIANGVVGMVLGSIAGYYFGQTTSRNRSPQP